MSNFDSLTISMATVALSLSGAIAQGLNARALLRRAGIDPALLPQGQARIPIAQFIRLCRLSSGKLNDEHYGLLDRPQRLGSYRAIAINSVHAKNLRGALQRYTQLGNLFENSLRFDVRENGRQVQLFIERRPGMRVLNSFAIDTALMIAHRFGNWLIGERITLEQVKIDYSPTPAQEHQYLFYGAPVLARQSVNALTFDAAYLERPIVQNESTLESYLHRAPANLYLPLEESGQLSLQLRQLLAELPEHQLSSYTLADACQALDRSPDRLRRQLTREGASFQSLRGAIRRERAIHYLASSDDSIEQIAYKTGYTEPGAFIRAFKGWTGHTPLQFRKRLDH